MVITVLLADDHGVVRTGVKTLLEANADMNVVATANDGGEAVEKAAALQPGVVVMDISMPGLSGIEATRAIAQRAPKTAVVMLSMHSAAEVVRRAFAAGARGYLLKECAGEEVVTAVRTVAAGHRFFGEGIANTIRNDLANIRNQTGIESLSPREREVLKLVVEGKSNAEAAATLGISSRTVETYRASLMEKLCVEDLPALVKLAIRHGITSLD
jgi:DNA-binding NarL/FixJ family response regulator